MNKPAKTIRHRPAVGGKLAPNELARRVIQDHHLVTDPFGNTYRYNGQHWTPMDLRVLERLCCQYDSWEHTTRKRAQETAYFVQHYSLMEDGIPWNNLKATEIPFQNGVYDLATLSYWDDVENDEHWIEGFETETTLGLRDHKPEDYLETVWPVNWNPFAECPTWDQYLQDCFGNLPEYPDYVAAIEEFLGYLLMTQAPYKKALLCYGESNTGKTVLENVMIALVGEQNICHIAIDKMNNPRIVAPIHGKAVNLMSELKFDTIMADSGFKQLVSTGESIQIDPKYKDPFPYVPFCKHVVFTNEKPNIQDHSQAVFNRLIVIEFPNVIPTEKQDPGLFQKLETELEGIALKALKGLRRLTYNKGRFTMPPSVEKALASYQQETNPMYEFLEECFLSKPQGMTLMADVREAFWQYFPRTKYWSPKKITQLLKAAGCEIAETSHKGEKGKYLLGYQFKKRYQHPHNRLEFDGTSEGGETETSDF